MKYVQLLNDGSYKCSDVGTGRKYISFFLSGMRNLLLAAGLITASAGVQNVLAQTADPVEVLQKDINALKSDLKKLQKLKVSGYFQVQAEFAQEYGSTKTGGTTAYQPDKDSDSGSFYRFGVRRGRVKIAWEEELGTAVFQLDITEKGVGFKDAYLKIWDPKKIVTITGGVFDRPFGDEISYSSSRRESPERSAIFQALFPDERDLGIMLTIAAPKNSAMDGLKLDAGLFSGNGIRTDDNSKMDFIGHLKYDKKWSNKTFGIGGSMYHGGTNNAVASRYDVVKEGNAYTWKQTEGLKENTINKRQYFGIDSQFSIETKSGITNIRGEFLTGVQPSKSGNFGSPRSDTYDSNSAFNYIRKFSGGHAYFIQDIYNTPLTFVFKYGYMNPNKEWKEKKTNKTDLAYNSYGFGFLWKINSYTRLQAFHEILVNEKTDEIAVADSKAPNGTKLDYSTNVPDNVFTLRLQYRF